MAPDGEYMIVRQSDAHAWAEAIVDGKWQRFDPTGAVAPSRVERGLGAALPLGEPVPYLARLEMTWLKNLRLHWDAINYQWQRGIVGFNIDRQRDVLRGFGLDSARPAQLVAGHRGHGVRLGDRSAGAVAGSSHARRRRSRAVGARLSPPRARGPRAASRRRASRLCRARGAALAAMARAVRADRRPATRSFATALPTRGARRCCPSCAPASTPCPARGRSRAEDQ